VDRHTKTKKSTFCNLEIFRLREKDTPIQVIEMKDTVTAFAWEPKGDRFALITTNDPNFGQQLPGSTVKTIVGFYALDTRKGDFKQLSASTIFLFWALPRN
jgi:translation initiation factor 3 subunit B